METARLKIRKSLSDDGQDLFEYLSQEEVVKYEPYRVFTREQAEQEAINRSKNPDFWAVCLKDTVNSLAISICPSKNLKHGNWAMSLTVITKGMDMPLKQQQLW